MTTTETDAPAEEEEQAEQPPATPPSGSPPAEPPALEGEAHPARNEPLWTRAILPLVLPIAAVVATVVWVLNLSRAFLAGGSTGSVVMVMVVTLTIMAGGAIMSAAPRLRTSTLLMLVGALLLFIISAGFVSLGPSENKEEAAGGYVPPTGKPVGTLSVQAEANTTFNSDSYEVPTNGIIDIKYSGAPGHTLTIDDPKFSGSGFLLHSSPKSSEKAKLSPGKYTIYCTVPGHAATMHATVTVG